MQPRMPLTGVSSESCWSCGLEEAWGARPAPGAAVSARPGKSSWALSRGVDMRLPRRMVGKVP